MKTLIAVVSLLTLTLSSATVVSAQNDEYVVLFTQPTYRGTPKNFNGPTPSVSRDRTYRRVGSVTIGRGIWELCEGENYTGRCVTLDQSVPDFSVYNLRSVRSLRPARRVTPVRDWYIVLFDQPTYRGTPKNFNASTSDVDVSWNRRARSVTVGRGVWELCNGPNFTGRCLTVSQSVPDLLTLGFRGRVRSLRPVPRQPR